MKARETTRIGASAKSWRGVFGWLWEGPEREGPLEAGKPRQITGDAGVQCCMCERPIPAEEVAVSKWGDQYICERCYYLVECVAMREPEGWRVIRPTGCPRRSPV